MDEFLNEVEIIGKQLKPVLEGVTGEDKMETLRKALVGATVTEEEETKEMIKRLVKMQSHADDELVVDEEQDDPKDRWDCETILSELGLSPSQPNGVLTAWCQVHTQTWRTTPVLFECAIRGRCQRSAWM